VAEIEPTKKEPDLNKIASERDYYKQIISDQENQINELKRLLQEKLKETGSQT